MTRSDDLLSSCVMRTPTLRQAGVSCHDGELPVWAGRTNPREACVCEEALTSSARLCVDPMRDWSRSDELRSLAPLADLSRSYELTIFLESRSDELSDIGELSPTVLLGAAQTNSNLRRFYVSKGPSRLPPRDLIRCIQHTSHQGPLVLSSHCSRHFNWTTRARNMTRQGPGENRESTPQRFRERPRNILGEQRKGLAPLWTSVPFVLAHNLAGCTSEFHGTQKMVPDHYRGARRRRS